MQNREKFLIYSLTNKKCILQLFDFNDIFKENTSKYIMLPNVGLLQWKTQKL